jgi:hypothetical protein
MKKNILLSMLILLSGMALKAQITFENTYNHSGTFTNLSISGSKFYLMDVANNQCRIYNTNHSLWKTINLSLPANHYLYDIKYVSENLFATDNSLCLAYTYYSYDDVNQYYTYTTKIIKENGTELLAIPGCAYVLVYEAPEPGTKLQAYVYDYSISPYTVQTQIYNLPGNLVSIENAEHGNMSKNTTAFPNPAKTFSTISYSLPANIQSAELQIFDMNGKKIRTLVIDAKANYISLPTMGFPSGVYTYIIQAANFRSEAGKLIIN